MRVMTKKLLLIATTILTAVCLLFSGVFAFTQTKNVKADAAALEAEFTNGQFSVTQYGVNMLEYVDAANLGTGEGAVLKIAANASAYVIVDFSVGNIKAADVESIVVRIYSPGYTASDSFRCSDNPTTTWLMNTSEYTMSSWCDVTLSSTVIEYMTDDSGYLTNSIIFGARVNSGATEYYIDSITVNMIKKVDVTFSTIHGTWNNYAYDNAYCTFLQFTGGISGNGDLDADFSDLLSKMTLNGEAVDTNNISFRCPNWIGASGGIIMRIATNPAVDSVLYLPAGASFDIGGSDTNIYVIATDTYIKFDGTAWAVCDKPVELELATFVGPWGSSAFNSSTQVLLQYSSEAVWDATNKGDLASKITYRNSETNATYSATESDIVGWDGQRWIRLMNLTGYDIIEIAEGGTFGGNIEIPALTLYNVNGCWVTTAPHAATTAYTAIAGGWNNNVVSSLSNNILVFDVNPLGNAADATNLAATLNRTSLMVKYNGKTFYELYTGNNAYSISYAHGNNYFYFAIPEADLVEDAIFEIEDGTPFMNAYLGGVQLVYNGSEWEECAPEMTPTVEFSAIGAGGTWNNLTGSDGVTSHTIITYSAVLDGASGTADTSSNLAATANWTAKMVKFNGKSFYELYQTNHQYQISYAHGGNYFYFIMPISALVATEDYPVPTLTIEKGTPFMAQYLPATTLYLQDGVWTDTLDATNYNPDFVSVGSLNHYDNTAMNAYGLSLIYDTTGFTTEGNQVMASSATGFTLNGETVNPALWGGEQLLFWLAKDKCVSGYNGYSHATLVIEEGATLTNESEKTFTLGGATLYLVDGAWTTTQPDGYHVEIPNASFVDFTIEGVGATQNHADNGTFYQLTLDFNGGALAFNQHASAVSGMTFNGVPMTCGGAPSGDSVMVITLGNGLWIHYTAEQATAGYKNYSHPTIHFEEGATVTDKDGKTTTYAELTLYLVDGAWTTEQPDGWTNVKKLTYSSIVWNNIDYAGFDVKYGLSGGALILIGYNELISDGSGQYANETNLITNESSVGNNIKVNGVALKDVEGAYSLLYAGYLYVYVPICEVLTIEDGTEVYGNVLSETTFYFTSTWSTEELARTSVTFDHLEWNNHDYNGYSTIYGQENHVGKPSNGFCGLISYSEALGTAPVTSNMATAYLDIGNKFKVNGVAAKDIEGAYIGYNAASTFLYFYIPFDGLTASDVYTVTIEAGAKFMNATLPATTYYFYDGLLYDNAPIVVTVQYGEVSVSNRFSGTQVIDTQYLSDALSSNASSVCPLIWTIDGTQYYVGESAEVSATTTVVIAEAVEFETMLGASVRITNDGNYGIRFESRIELDSYNALVAKYGETNIKTGTYIVPKALFDAAGMSIAQYFAQEKGEGSASKYVNVSNFDIDKNKNGIFNKTTYETDGYIQYYGALTNLKSSNYYTQFFGVGYITITMGEKTVTVYGLTDVLKTNRTIYDVARMAYSDLDEEYSDDALTVLQQYIDSVAVLTYSNGNLFADTEVTGREYVNAYSVSLNGDAYTITSSVNPKAVVVNGVKLAVAINENSGVYSFDLTTAYLDENFGSSLQYGLGEPNYVVWGDGTENANDTLLAGVAQELGVTSYRVWVNGQMGSVGAGNVVSLGTTHTNALKSHVKSLIDGGVKEILFANGNFMMPYNYPCYYVTDANNNYLWVSTETYLGGGYSFVYQDYHAVPNPATEAEAYATWLKAQYDYYVLFAQLIDSWKSAYGWTENVVKFYFEGINEPEFQGLIHKRGTYADGTYTCGYYSTNELAKIFTDVAYYMTLAVGDTGYVTTPALTNIASNSNSPLDTHGVYCDTLLNAMYEQINDAVAPTAISGIAPANTNDENDYFTCLNWHPYLPWFKAEDTTMYYGEIVTKTGWFGITTTTAEVNSNYANMWVAWNNAMYQIAVNGGDTDSPKVFFSEFGVCDWGSPVSGNYNKMGINEGLAATVFKTLLGSANNLTFVDELTVMAFRVFDNEELGSGEGNFGMIDDNGQIKAIMKEYYVIINGNDDTSSLQAKIDEYFN